MYSSARRLKKKVMEVKIKYRYNDTQTIIHYVQ